MCTGKKNPPRPKSGEKPVEDSALWQDRHAIVAGRWCWIMRFWEWLLPVGRVRRCADNRGRTDFAGSIMPAHTASGLPGIRQWRARARFRQVSFSTGIATGLLRAAFSSFSDRRRCGCWSGRAWPLPPGHSAGLCRAGIPAGEGATAGWSGTAGLRNWSGCRLTASWTDARQTAS